jgi:hypothetical protein
MQAPALAGLLPKLHLNHHTLHAVIFGNQQFGGLALPDLYTDQGFQQVKFMVDHLHIQDNVKKLILIAMSNLQLIPGSTQSSQMDPKMAVNLKYGSSPTK